MKRLLVRYRTAIPFLGGALFMAIFGAPLWGAISSLFWTPQRQIFDGRGGDTIAADDVIGAIGEHWAAPIFMPPNSPGVWERPDTGDQRDCDTQFRRNVGKFSEAAPYVLTGLYRAVSHEEQRMDKLETDEAARASFVSLPRPVLGALAECMKHSLLSGLCVQAARHRLDNDGTVQARIAALKLKNAKIGGDQACLVLETANRVVSQKGIGQVR